MTYINKTMFGHGTLITYTCDHLEHFFDKHMGTSLSKPSIHVGAVSLDWMEQDPTRVRNAFDLLTASIEGFEAVYGIRPREDDKVSDLQDILMAYEMKQPSADYHADHKADIAVMAPAVRKSGEINLQGIQALGEQADIAWDDNNALIDHDLGFMLRTILPAERKTRDHVAKARSDIGKILQQSIGTGT